MQARTVLAALIVLIALAGCAEVQEKAPAGDYVMYPGTAAITPVMTVQFQGYHVDVLSDAPEWPTSPVVTSIPNPTGTPVLTSPTPISASVTPIPTNTLRPSPTSAENSPTPDGNPLPTIAATSFPKPTETPMPGTCWGTVSVAALNVRSAPGGTILGQVHSPDILRLEARQIINGVTWYQIYWLPDQNGWVSGNYLALGEGSSCTFDTAWGVWVGPGASRDELIVFGRTLQAAGITPAATVYGDATTATTLYDLGWLVAWRPFIGDCPDMSTPPEVSARIWFAQALQHSIGVRYTYLSLSNECTWPSAQYLNAWILEALARAKAANIPRVIPTVFNTGSPEMNWIPILRPALTALSAPNCIGFNQYPVRKEWNLSTFDSWSQYTTYRYEIMSLPASTAVCVTEFARGDGNIAPDFQDIGAYVRRIDGHVLFATAWYDALTFDAWRNANLQGRLGELAQTFVSSQ